MRWCVYIVQSETRGTLYTGISLDPKARLRQHNGLVKGGARATRAGRPWSLVYLEHLPDKSEALRREAQIKRMRRAEKLLLVQGALESV